MRRSENWLPLRARQGAKRGVWGLAPIISLLVLSACDPRPQSQIDPAKFLGKLMEKEGPQVDGVDATLLSSAHQAEEKREYGRAVQFYQQLLDGDKENTVYILGLADNLRRMSQFDEALARYNALLSKQPDNVEAMEGRGLCQLSKGDFDAASDQFKQVLAKDANRWRSLNAVGILFVMKEMPKEALSYYDQALKIKPDEPAILNNVGLTMALTQDYPHAIEALVRAGGRLLDADPQKKRADLNLALVYGLSGDMEKAEQTASKHLKDSALNNNLGFYAYLADNKELAKAYLNNALSGSAVFYEKAWKNLEVVGGAKVEQRNQTRGTGFAPRSSHRKDAPFSVYPPEETQPVKAASAPVMPVTSGQDLEALVLEDDKSTPPAVPELPAALPVTPEDSHVEVFPAVPVNPMMGDGIRPVSMPITGDVNAILATMPQPMEPAANAPGMMPAASPQMPLPQAQVMPAAPLPEPAPPVAVATEPKPAPEEKTAEERKTLKSSSILQKIKNTKLPEADKKSETEHVTTLTPKLDPVPEDMTSALPSEMGGIANTESLPESRPARLKNPHSEMIIYQAKPKAEEKPVAEEKKPDPAETAAAPVVEKTADAPEKPAITTTLKPRKAEPEPQQPAAAEAPAPQPQAAAAPAPALEPQAEAPITTPGAAEEHPVQRKSTLDVIKQIF